MAQPRVNFQLEPMSADGSRPTTPPHFDIHRKPSNLSDYGHDNPTFESPARSRKVSSANSEHAEIGPVRKKSILHLAHNSGIEAVNQALPEVSKQVNGDSRCQKHSISESISAPKPKYTNSDEDNSWWYTFCFKCRKKDADHPSWEPPMWSSICPYPFCPTYRQFSRIIGIAFIGLFLWGVTYAIIGEPAAPGGQLFQLILLSLCAHFGGWLVSLTTLPALIGMLFTGLLFQNVGFVNFDESFKDVTKELRKIALVIILTRAGLDMDPHALKKLKITVPKLGLVPWTIEAAVVAILSHYLLNLPWDWCLLLGTIIAAVSPAVVVPCLFRLRTKGYGVAKGIPTLIIAVAGIDDAASVAGYGIIQSIMFSQDSLTSQILQGPICLLGGIGFGIVWGTISNFIPERHDPFVVPLRIMMLLSGGLIAVFGSELIGYEGAGPLGCVAAAFVCLCFWTKHGWEVEDNPASTAFEIFWMIFEPILFGITGAQIKFAELQVDVVTIGLGILVAGVLIRICSTVVIGIGSKLNLKEKIFVALSWMSKATVQAALGPIALSIVGDKHPEKDYAEKVLMICVLSIILTAPTGAILITLSGSRLLTKLKIHPHIPEGWKRSHRPSIYDISIINEEDEEKRDSGEVENESSIEKPNLKHEA
ncbi:hypothetical protein RI129_004862 [Pyrocoelia pectoralis]|uniref:Cation/H+ exchanger transmembrane domain-containing protein n=1 Tax=Pyrocoelia pectoralis TaxID=417401 RepID=A0AAN7VJP1_9COLE